MLQKGLEEQAIGRIHRIGQKKRTFVWRYLVEASIEIFLANADRNDQHGYGIESKDRGEIVTENDLSEFWEPLIEHSDITEMQQQDDQEDPEDPDQEERLQ